jgi:hypothetical protein
VRCSPARNATLRHEVFLSVRMQNLKSLSNVRAVARKTTAGHAVPQDKAYRNGGCCRMA